MKSARIPKRSTLPCLHPAQLAIEPRFRPRLVFSRGATAGAGKRPDAAPRVLVVEDDFLVSTQIEEALSEAGFEAVDVVATAEDAVGRGATRNVMLVVMDIRLAGKGDGIDAAIELFERHGIRSIFATAHADPEVRERAQKAKPIGWLQKPYTMASLVAAVRDALNAKGS